MFICNWEYEIKWKLNFSAKAKLLISDLEVIEGCPNSGLTIVI